MGGGEGKEFKEEREGAGTTTPPPPPLQAQAPPPKKGKGGKATTGKKRKRFESDSDSESEHPASSSSSSSGEDSAPTKTKAVPAPEEKRERRRRRGVGKKRGGGGRSGGAEPNDPLVGTTTHVPYGGGVEVGSVTGVHTRKSGVVWVKYPNNPKLYEVERHLIFGTAEAAEAHLNPPTNPQENPQPNQSTPGDPLTPQLQSKVPRHYGTRKRAPERCNT